MRRFALSLRDVEELLAERGIVVTYETVRSDVTAHATAPAFLLGVVLGFVAVGG